MDELSWYDSCVEAIFFFIMNWVLFYHPLNVFPTQAPDPPKGPKVTKPTEPAPDRSISINSLHGDKGEEPQIK